MQYDPSDALLDLSALSALDTRYQAEQLARHKTALETCIENRRLEVERLEAYNEHLIRLIATTNRVTEGLKREHDQV